MASDKARSARTDGSAVARKDYKVLTGSTPSGLPPPFGDAGDRRLLERPPRSVTSVIMGCWAGGEPPDWGTCLRVAALRAPGTHSPGREAAGELYAGGTPGARIEAEEGRSPWRLCDNPMCSCDPCGCGEGCACGGAKLEDLERRVMEILWANGGPGDHRAPGGRPAAGQRLHDGRHRARPIGPQGTGTPPDGRRQDPVRRGRLPGGPQSGADAAA